MTNEPQTLAEMQSMTTDDFRAVDRYLWRGDPSKKRVIDHLVDLAADELSWQGRDDAGSLRDFWYNPVKAVLESAFPTWGDGAGTSDWNREMTKRLSGVVSEKVKSGEMTYRDLNILDDSRDRRIATNSIEHDKIIFVEKSAAYRKLKPLADTYDLTIVEGSGWQATALIEDLGQQLDPGVEYTFWVLGDFDPTGFGIVEDFVDRAAEMGITVDRDASRRIGIWPDQVSDATLRNQKFTVASTGNDDVWFDEHAIDGQYGLEIEAVGDDLEGKAEALRQLVVNEIGDEIDADERRFQDTEQSARRVPSGAASRVLNEITDDLEAALVKAAAEQYAEQDGVVGIEVTGSHVRSVDLDRDATLNGETGDLVPDPYDASRLHSAAVSGRSNDFNPSGGRTAKRALAESLRERLADADDDLDPSDLLNI